MLHPYPSHRQRCFCLKVCHNIIMQDGLVRVGENAQCMQLACMKGNVVCVCCMLRLVVLLQVVLLQRSVVL